jgi:hypothetical protein
LKSVDFPTLGLPIIAIDVNMTNYHSICLMNIN